MKKILQYFEDAAAYAKPELTKFEAFVFSLLKKLFGVKSSGVDASGK